MVNGIEHVAVVSKDTAALKGLVYGNVRRQSCL